MTNTQIESRMQALASLFPNVFNDATTEQIGVWRAIIARTQPDVADKAINWLAENITRRPVPGDLSKRIREITPPPQPVETGEASDICEARLWLTVSAKRTNDLPFLAKINAMTDHQLTRAHRWFEWQAAAVAYGHQSPTPQHHWWAWQALTPNAIAKPDDQHLATDAYNQHGKPKALNRQPGDTQPATAIAGKALRDAIMQPTT